MASPCHTCTQCRQCRRCLSSSSPSDIAGPSSVCMHGSPKCCRTAKSGPSRPQKRQVHIRTWRGAEPTTCSMHICLAKASSSRPPEKTGPYVHWAGCRTELGVAAMAVVSHYGINLTLRVIEVGGLKGSRVDRIGARGIPIVTVFGDEPASPRGGGGCGGQGEQQLASKEYVLA